MPTPRLSPGHPEWPNVERAWRVYHDEWGEKMGAVKAAADAVGRSHKTVRHWIEVYRTRLHTDPAILEGMDTVGTGMVPRMAWAKTSRGKDGDTRHRYALTGHVHHDQAKDVGGLRWESLRAFCPPDAWAAGMGFAPRRAMQALTFHKRDGLVLRALDPIETEATR